MEITYLNSDSIFNGSINRNKLIKESFKTLNNISLIGDGDIVLTDYPVYFNASEITLKPNVYYRCTNKYLSIINISLEPPYDNSILNEYFIEFYTAKTGTSVILPANVTWVNSPVFMPNKIYQISICNNIGVVSSFKQPFTDDYLTVEALEDDLTVSLSLNNCEYCIDSNNIWQVLPANTYTTKINKGQTISFRGNLIPLEGNGIGTFTITKKCNLKGNCMSMLFGDNAKYSNDLTGYDYAFYELFANCTNIVNISDDFLSATTLANNCYSYMFYECNELINAPTLPATVLTENCYSHMFYNCSNIKSFYKKLPATTLANNCYSNMFSGCVSLIEAPELPATTLTNGCYNSMFSDCTSLTTAPELPASILADNCYYRMFYNCINLNYIKMHALNINATGCLTNWVYNVGQVGTFYKMYLMKTLQNGYNGIPEGWNIETIKININNYLTIEALEDGLTASLSINSCEYCIDNSGEWKLIAAGNYTTAIKKGQTISFRGNLTPTLNTGIGTFTITKQCNLKGNCMSILFGDNASNITSLKGYGSAFEELFYNCKTIQAVDTNFLPATTLHERCYVSMFQGCTSLTQAPELHATTLAPYCYEYMFCNCTSLLQAPELPVTTLSTGCYEYMFYGCTSLTTAPDLPAISLTSYCYTYMFYKCSKLNYIKALFNTTPGSSYTSNWLYGVASTGTFVKNKNATWTASGASGVPSNWEIKTVFV